MVSLQKVKSGGRTYWRIVESRRVGGKPRPVPILHLGTANALFDRLLKAPEGQLRIQSFQHGDVAALKAAADRLGVEEILERHLQKLRKPKRRWLAIGRTLLLAAFNRAVKPRSKRAWAKWAKGTSLHRLFPGLGSEHLTSQFFWDQMDCVPLQALCAMEEELTKVIVKDLGVELDTLLYDTTNFFTFIASTNTRSKLTSRGRSKQKRHDLRLFSLALLVARDGHIPLCSHVYKGKRVDAKVFPESLTKIRERLASLSLSLVDVTLVYDKGNNSKKNQSLIDGLEVGYVASVCPAHHGDLMDIPVEEYEPFPEDSPLASVPRLRLTKNIWGVERTVLLYFSQQLHDGQVRGLEQHLQKRLAELEQWRQDLEKPRSGPRNEASAQKRIATLLSGQYVKQVLRVEYHHGRKGGTRLEFWIDEEAREQLEKEYFGKRILVTNRHTWNDEEILLAYRGQSHVEEAFRQLKDDEHLAVRPQYHWTDQKVHVHTFMCLLALLLSRVVENEARRFGRREGLSGVLDLLGTIRLAMVLRPSGKKGGRPRCQWQLEECESEVLKLFQSLVPNKPPFVYTGGTG
ncbi:MAG: IS1634 family transposase [Planctomycetota bacterium]